MSSLSIEDSSLPSGNPSLKSFSSSYASSSPNKSIRFQSTLSSASSQANSLPKLIAPPLSSVNISRKRSKAGQGGEDEEVDLDILHQGSLFLKFGRKGPAHERFFWLSEDNRFLHWDSSIFSCKSTRDSRLDLYTVSRIQRGQMTVNFDRHKEVFGTAGLNSFSLISTERTLDLIAPTTEAFKTWFMGLRQVLQLIQRERDSTKPEIRFLKEKFDLADKDNSGTLTKEEIVKLVAKLNISLPKAQVNTIYRDVDVDGNGKLSFDEFCFFVEKLKRRPELEFLWQTLPYKHKMLPLDLPDAFEPFDQEKYSNSLGLDDIITLSQLKLFLEDEQGMKVTEGEVKKLMKDAMGDYFEEANPVLTYPGFVTLLTRADNDVFDSRKLARYQDMNLPLSYYFMASSHNTYLEGDQLRSNSSVNRYVNDLCRGCRCVELDCWNGDEGEPIIYHGHTLTSKINFRDVIEAIDKYAFQSTPYPIVLSIENHCGLKQQEIMADIMISTFGEKLLMPGDMLGEYLPSLEQLKYKILVKGKRLKAKALADLSTDVDQQRMSTISEKEEKDNDDDDDGDGEEEKGEDDDQEAKGDDDDTKSVMSVDTISTSATSSIIPSKKDKEGKNKKAHKEKTHQKLSDITYLGTCHCKSFDPEVSNAIPPDMMTSYSEDKTFKYLKDPDIVAGWIRHNQKHLSRIYPRGTRIDSSNMDVVPPWAAGNQLVALNYQTAGLSMQLNFGRFRENGKCGYVLKPAYMLDNKAWRRSLLRLNVHVISGQQLPKPGGASKGEIIDPYVIVAVYGFNAAPLVEKTSVIDNNGFSPVWNQVLSFDVRDPDIAMVLFTVMDKDRANADDFVAQAAIPFSCLATGYRHINLYDFNCEREKDFEFARLFVRISFEEL